MFHNSFPRKRTCFTVVFVSASCFFTLLFPAPLLPEDPRHTELFVTLKTQAKKPLENDEWPQLSQLQAPNGTIIGDVQHLLDFVIAGHPKTGTTSLMTWLSVHPQVYIRAREVQSNLKIGHPVFLVKELSRIYPPGYGRKRGYKAPNEIHFRPSIRLLAKYWPRTKILVGVRHPVTWFNSWYNFKINNGKEMPALEDYNMNKVKLPTILRFHENLSLLGKTSLDADERVLLGESRRVFTLEQEDLILESVGIDPSDTSAVPNKVFLYDIKQADGANLKVSAQFRSDLGDFLGISTIPDQPRKNTMTRFNFDICETKFRPLRQKLIAQGKVMSEWILKYFIKHPDVTVSSPEYFEELLRSWGADPCESTS